MERIDVAIIGAGVVGLFTAIALGRRGYSVAVVEQHPRPMAGVSARSANVIHVIQTPFRSLKSRLCLEGNRMHREVHEILGYRLHEMRLLLAYTSKRMRPIAALTARLLPRLLPQAQGPRVGVRHLPGRAARDLEPGLSDSVEGAVEVTGYAVVEPSEMATALEAGARRYGELILGARATRISVDGDGVLVEAGDTSIRARAAVNAGGLESYIIAKIAGDPGYVQEAWKGVMSIHPSPRLRSIVAPLEVRKGETKGGGAIPQADGTLLLGPTNSGPASPGDYTYTSEDLEWLRSRFQPLLSEELPEPERVVVGLRPVSPGRDFIVEWGSSGRVVHLVGIESPGLTAAPALARMVASMIAGRLG